MGLNANLSLSAFEDARERTQQYAIKSPLLRLQFDGSSDTYVKLENLQSIGSFKIRGAVNALMVRGAAVARGAFTASAGNFGQGLAYAGQRLGLPITVYAPDTAAASKLDALKRMGATVQCVPYKTWWQMLADPQADPAFIHPFADDDVLAGNGVIGLEILEALPKAAIILAPYGGGGLSVGIGAAIAAAGSHARVIACETEAGAPVRAAFAAGEPVNIDFNSRTFVTGMGAPCVMASMWPLVKVYIAGTALVSLEETAAAIRLLADRHHVIAEGAGAAPVAAAVQRQWKAPTVCIVSGGHLDRNHLIAILNGATP